MARSHSRGLLYTGPPKAPTNRGDSPTVDADEPNDAATEASHSNTSAPADD